MKSYSLNIAGYNIRFESSDHGPDLSPAEKFRNFKTGLTGGGLHIKVHHGKQDLPERARRIFHAPYVEENDGARIEHSPEFWSIWNSGDDLFIKSIFPLSSGQKKAVLKFSLDSPEWDLWIDSEENAVDPLQYPLDALLLYYLTVIHNDIMIHASGVDSNGSGYLFSGISGKGKTTMAHLWKESGAKIIHDDRLILRKESDGYYMHNSPVYDNEVAMKCHPDRIFIIEHGDENKLVRLNETNAVSRVLANCIQHNWGTETITRLLGSVSDLCSEIPVYKLFFRPDKDAIDYILDNY